MEAIRDAADLWIAVFLISKIDKPMSISPPSYLLKIKNSNTHGNTLD